MTREYLQLSGSNSSLQCFQTWPQLSFQPKRKSKMKTIQSALHTTNLTQEAGHSNSCHIPPGDSTHMWWARISHHTCYCVSIKESVPAKVKEYGLKWKFCNTQKWYVFLLNSICPYSPFNWRSQTKVKAPRMAERTEAKTAQGYWESLSYRLDDPNRNGGWTMSIIPMMVPIKLKMSRHCTKMNGDLVTRDERNGTWIFSLRKSLPKTTAKKTEEEDIMLTSASGMCFKA